MENPIKIIKNFPISWKKIWLPFIIFIVIFGILTVGLISYGKTYDDKILPGIYIGDILVSGMNRSEITEYLGSMNDKLSKEGIQFYFSLAGNKEIFTIFPSIIADDQIIDLVVIDIDSEVDRLLSYNKYGNIFVQSWNTGVSRVIKPHLKIQNISLNEDQILAEVHKYVSKYEQPAREAGVRVDTISPLKYTITTSSPGVAFNYENITKQILDDWSVLSMSEIELHPEVKNSKIDIDRIEQIAGRVESILSQGSIDIGYTDSYSKRNYNWTISKQDISLWMEVQEEENGNLVFGLNKDKVIGLLQEEILKIVNREPKNAKFSIATDNRVKEFQGSRSGVSLNLDATYNAINSGFKERMLHDEGTPREIAVVTTQVEPEINTGEVNDLGINEILGVGYSNFKGSPANRIKNIRFAVEQKLNGLLIKPGDEFSLLNALSPFTIDGGYLPELVIKGDEIKPEVAGGLCQVGTTMFRAVMNSGLPVTARSSHSLVVSYYNDHRNNLPGTDATIYEPAPDFKFKNDTGNYLLLTTEMNMATQDIFFTLWGTNDGRKGYYSVPIVSKWLPTGPEKEIQTTDLEPGVKKCQSQHPGAIASFTYTRELPGGEKVDRVFESYYRPLPKICLVGVEKQAQEQQIPDFIAEDLGIVFEE